MNNRLIMIDGVSGSGKSTTAQFLAWQYNLNGHEAEWYHEEEDEHPLLYSACNIETMHSHEEARVFMRDYPGLLEAFVKKVKDDNKVHIIESYYLQDSIRILFQNNIPKEEIISFFKKMNDIIQPLNPLIIYFHHNDVIQSIRNIWRERGEEWKKWFIDEDSKTPYVKKKNLTGEDAALTLWNDYQVLTDMLLELSLFRVITIDYGDAWSTIYEHLLDTINLKHIPLNHKIDIKKYPGEYIQKTDDESPHELRIFISDTDMYMNLCWLGQVLIPVANNEFIIRGFPLHIRFNEQDGTVGSFTVSGKQIYGLSGNVYVRK